MDRTPSGSHAGSPDDTGSIDFVGRESELSVLTAALPGPGDVRGVALISGDAGIGKTALVETLERHARQNGITVLHGTCYDTERMPAFDPWSGLLRSAISEAHVDWPELPSEDLPQFSEQTAAFNAMDSALAKLARSHPLLIVLEDLHRADLPSVELFRSLIRSRAADPVLFVATYCDTEMRPDGALFRLLPALIREAQPLRVHLRPLAWHDLQNLVDIRYHLPESDTNRLTDYLSRYAEGNPFFAIELATTLEEQGILRRNRSGWQLDTLTGIRVPVLIRQIIGGRITHLSHQCADLLHVAAVIGFEVPIQLWQDVTRASDDDLVNCIEQAVAANLIEEDATSGMVRFRHVLFREGLYNDLVILRRRMWHTRIAGVLAEAVNPDTNAVAYHFRKAGDSRALDWLIEAGRNAARTNDYRSAAARFEEALAVLDESTGDIRDRAWLLCELASAYRFINPQRALRYLNIARDMADNLHDSALMAVVLSHRSQVRGTLGEPMVEDLQAAVDLLSTLSGDDRRRIHAIDVGGELAQGTLAHRFASCARFDVAIRLGTEFLETAGMPITPSEHFEHGLAHLAIANANAHLGRPEDARAAFVQARTHLDATDNHLHISEARQLQYRVLSRTCYPELLDERHDVAASARATDSYWALIDDGRWDEAREAAERSLKSDFLRIPSAAALAELDLRQGFHVRASATVTDIMPLGPGSTPGTHYSEDFLRLQRVAARLETDAGNLDKADQWIRAIDCWLGWPGTVLDRHVPLILRARLSLNHGFPDRAIVLGLQALDFAGRPRQPRGLMAAHRVVGEAQTEIGSDRRLEAEEHLRTALALAESFQDPYAVALCKLSLARLLAIIGKMDEAQTHITSARRALQDLGARPALARIDEVELQVRTPGRPSSRPVLLSPRELEILTLVARGLTDAEIGDRIFISRRTVSGHLRSIYSKLGVSTRTAATTYAYQHNLISPTGSPE